MFKTRKHSWVLLLIAILVAVLCYYIWYRKSENYDVKKETVAVQVVQTIDDTTKSTIIVQNEPSCQPAKQVDLNTSIDMQTTNQSQKALIKETSRRARKMNKKKAKAQGQQTQLTVQLPEQNSVHVPEMSDQKEPCTTVMCTLKDMLDKKNFGYKHWSGTHYPNKLIFKINGVTILTFDGKNIERPAKEVKIDIKKPMKVYFEWQFRNSDRYSGWRENTYDVSALNNVIELDFDWKDKEQQLIVKNARITGTRAHDNNK